MLSDRYDFFLFFFFYPSLFLIFTSLSRIHSPASLGPGWRMAWSIRRWWCICLFYFLLLLLLLLLQRNCIALYICMKWPLSLFIASVEAKAYKISASVWCSFCRQTSIEHFPPMSLSILLSYCLFPLGLLSVCLSWFVRYIVSYRSPALFHDQPLLLSLQFPISRSTSFFLFLVCLHLLAIWVVCFDFFSSNCLLIFDCVLMAVILISPKKKDIRVSETWKWKWKYGMDDENMSGTLDYYSSVAQMSR